MNRPLARFLDTSVVVRYLTGMPPDEAVAAGSIIDRSELLAIGGVALVETAYVLTSVYRLPRETVIDRLLEFVQRENIETRGLDKGYVIQGLLMCRPSGRVSVSDALIWAEARSAGGDTVYSFDFRFPSDGIEVRTGL